MMYRFTMVCPRCNKETVTVEMQRVPTPAINCGDCLMDDVNIVEFKVVKVEELEGP